MHITGDLMTSIHVFIVIWIVSQSSVGAKNNSKMLIIHISSSLNENYVTDNFSNIVSSYFCILAYICHIIHVGEKHVSTYELFSTLSDE